jgi:DNA polymerase III subunit beta
MKLTAEAGDLAQALALADLVLAAADPSVRKNLMLSAVRITAADTMVSFTLNVLDFSITTKTTAEVIELGEVAVSQKALSALMTGCVPSSTINISTTDKAMMIAADRGRFRLPTVPIADMPVVLVIDPENTIEIETAALMRLLKVMHTASTEMVRYYLNGVFLHSVNGTLVAVGTDGRQLMCSAVPAETFSTDRSCIVPLSAVTVVEKILKRIKPEKVALKRSKRLLVVETPDISFTTKLIDAEFPAYEKIIPEASANTITCGSSDLIAALKRLAAVAADGKALIALQWQDGQGLELFLAKQPDDGHDVVAAEATGNGQVAAQLSLLAELLEEIDGDTVSLSTDSSGAPIVIRLVGDERLVALLMPCAHNFTIRETAA